MAFCKTVDFLYEALPLRPFRGWLIRGHMEGCPRCQARLVSRDEARSLLVAPEAVTYGDAMWGRISSEAGRRAGIPETGPRRTPPAWQWAAAAAFAGLVAVTAFWLLREVERSGLDANSAGPADRFRIEYVNVGGAPAQTFVYQPQGSDTVFVWAQRTP